MTYRFINRTKLLKLLAQSRLVRMPGQATAASVSAGALAMSASSPSQPMGIDLEDGRGYREEETEGDRRKGGGVL